MNQTTYYIVQYNDCYGHGTFTKMEAIIKSKSDFKRWFKQHNAKRKEMGASRERREEFDLIPVKFFD